MPRKVLFPCSIGNHPGSSGIPSLPKPLYLRSPHPRRTMTTGFLPTLAERISGDLVPVPELETLCSAHVGIRQARARESARAPREPSIMLSEACAFRSSPGSYLLGGGLPACPQT